MGDSDDAEALAACFATDDHHDYNVGLHVAALFVIFFFSSLGALTPILASRYPRLSIPPVLLECGKFFGAGVILATSLIHMLPGAVSNFSSPCAPAVFSEYSAFPGLFTMLAIFLFHLMEHLLTGHFISEKNAPRSHHDHSHHPQAHDHNTNGHQVLELHSQHTHVHGGAFFSGAENETRRSSTYILEVGIAMHSVLIGLALGTASGTEFTSLFIALVIHQFFEGFALGSRLAELVFKRSAVPVASALIFAITTPIGVAIGMGVHSSYQANSPANLVTQGVLDSIAAGILLYSALVNLIAQEFSQASFYRQSKVRRALFFISMYTGAAVMAIIGIWA
ncbi:Zinc/iron permease [Dimargaris cristalligena]|uniref:Zinc/iron permease n=1 Tax=Dimargaris cristalligena TaxID=215637 RepID=A0A4P9ZV71_9FUNG|nr:Zinc/iron permease [Dimargaris cristalligena]|eukprot:RKP37516.1 Zinc/iron permease [Dimargaris cristalligena]